MRKRYESRMRRVPGSLSLSLSLSRSLCQGFRGLSLLAQRCVLGEMLTPLAEIFKNKCPGTSLEENHQKEDFCRILWSHVKGELQTPQCFFYLNNNFPC
jgi:hypothetical protein